MATRAQICVLVHVLNVLCVQFPQFSAAVCSHAEIAAKHPPTDSRWTVNLGKASPKTVTSVLIRRTRNLHSGRVHNKRPLRHAVEGAPAQSRLPQSQQDLAMLGVMHINKLAEQLGVERRWIIEHWINTADGIGPVPHFKDGDQWFFCIEELEQWAKLRVLASDSTSTRTDPSD